MNSSVSDMNSSSTTQVETPPETSTVPPNSPTDQDSKQPNDCCKVFINYSALLVKLAYILALLWYGVGSIPKVFIYKTNCPVVDEESPFFNNCSGNTTLTCQNLRDELKGHDYFLGLIVLLNACFFTNMLFGFNLDFTIMNSEMFNDEKHKNFKYFMHFLCLICFGVYIQVIAGLNESQKLSWLPYLIVISELISTALINYIVVIYKKHYDVKFEQFHYFVWGFCNIMELSLVCVITSLAGSIINLPDSNEDIHEKIVSIHVQMALLITLFVFISWFINGLVTFSWAFTALPDKKTIQKFCGFTTIFFFLLACLWTTVMQFAVEFYYIGLSFSTVISILFGIAHLVNLVEKPNEQDEEDSVV